MLNAGAAIYVGGRGRDASRRACALAEESIDSGAARDVLERYVAETQRARPRERGRDDARRDHALRRGSDIERRREQVALADLERAIAARGRGRPVRTRRWRSPGTSLIAEYKRRSPSAGDLPRGAEPVEQIVQAYERGGAAALCRCSPRSATSAARSPTCARRARPATLPILRKDFTLDRYQLYEARGGRRDAVLLIVVGARAASSWRASTRRPARSTSTASSRCTTRRSWRPRSRSTPT